MITLNTFKELYKKYQSRVKTEEIERVISYRIWKSLDCILEEINENRKKEQKDLPQAQGILFEARKTISKRIQRLLYSGQIERKFNFQFTENNEVWLRTSNFESEHPTDSNLAFYKFTKPRKPKKGKQKEKFDLLEEKIFYQFN